MKSGFNSTHLAVVACVMMTTAQTTAGDRLPSITVTGTAETAPAQKGYRDALAETKDIPGGASVVDMDVVKQGRVATWVDSLGLAPGVFVQERFGSEEARISIRGSALSRTYHGFGLKVMQDGIPINYADGFFDMQTVDPAAARYIDVLRGPNASAYGSGTLGGAINFVSPTGYDTDGVIGRAEAGSFGYARAQAIVGKVLRPENEGDPIWDYNLSFNTSRQDGYRDHSAQESQKAIANFGARINSQLDSRFFVGAVRSRSQLPGYLTRAQLLSDPTVAQDPTWPESFQRRDVDAYRLANKTVYTSGDYRLEIAAYAMQHELWHPIQWGVISQSTNTFGGHIKLMDKSKLFGLPNLMTFGYLPDAGVTDGSTRDPIWGQPYTTWQTTKRYSQRSQNQRLLIEDSLQVSDRTRVITSMQYHWSKREKQVQLGSDSSYDVNYSQWLPRIGVVHDIAPKTRFFANVSRVFEPPIFDVTSIMTATKAQTGNSYEAGLRGEADFDGGRHTLAYDFTVYRANLRNEFQTVCIDPSAGSCFAYGQSATVNVPRTVHQGVELGLSGVVDKHWVARGIFLYSDFRFDNDATYGNNRMPGFPPVILRGELMYRWSAGEPLLSYAGPSVEWVPTAAPMDNTGSVSNDPYAIFGFKAGGTIDTRWSWFFDMRNLADKKYAATTSIAGDYNRTPTAAYYPGNGRSAYIGLEGKW